jgi:hypothetical protein
MPPDRYSPRVRPSCSASIVRAVPKPAASLTRNCHADRRDTRTAPFSRENAPGSPLGARTRGRKIEGEIDRYCSCAEHRLGITSGLATIEGTDVNFGRISRRVRRLVQFAVVPRCGPGHCATDATIDPQR